jgi:hypothetical protein
MINARGDFLVTMFPVADTNQSQPFSLIFPQIANGAGYKTEIILLNPGGTTTPVTVFGTGAVTSKSGDENNRDAATPGG